MMKWVMAAVLVVVFLVRYEFIKAGETKYKPGQRVRIVVTYTGVKTMRTSGIVIRLKPGDEFDYGDKLELIGILEDSLNLDYQTVRKLKSGLGIREGMLSNLMKWLPGDEGGLAGGIMLGGSGLLTYDTKEAFTRTGLSHVVAASGYNVMVVAGWVMAGAVFLVGRRWAVPLGIASIGVYMYLAGMSAAVVRAGIMASVTIAGILWGRKADGGWLLVLTALGMLVVSPKYIHDIGWQLSIAAMGGLIWAEPNITDKLAIGGLKSTLAAQVTTIPLILYHFGNLSVVSPLINLAVLWAVPPIMQITAVGVILPPVNLLAWPLLKWMNLIVNWTADWSFASYEIGKIGWAWGGGYFLGLGICLRYWHL